MDYYPKVYGQIPVNTAERNYCSPENPGPQWLGIVLNTPKEAIGEKSKPFVVPVCGFYQVEMASLVNSHPLKFTVVEISSGKAFTGFMAERDPSPEIPNPFAKPLKPEQLKGMVSGAYFNPDLLKYVQMPVREGEYEVFAEFGGLKSNTAKFKITLK